MVAVSLKKNFFQAEDGIRDHCVTGVQTCALPIYAENVPEPETLELVRPASQGIRELAPSNDFYTQKLRLEIKGLSMNDRTDSVKLMRYCSECDALAEEGTPEYNMTCCPKCGSDSWHSNRHPYLRFTTATTSIYRSDAALDDRSEDREQKLDRKSVV